MTAHPLAAPLVDVPYTTVLFAWGLMIIVAGAALLGLVVLTRRSGRTDRPPRRRLSTEELDRLRAEAAEVQREALAASGKAHRAAVAAGQARARLVEAQRSREAAGREHDAAERAYQEVNAAWRAGEAVRERPRTGDEERQERDVSRAALHAYRRGDLSVDELREVFRRAGGWDPVQEERAHEIGLRRAEAHRTHRVYDAAVAAERVAGKASAIATVAEQALAEEAGAAAREARALRIAVEEYAAALHRGRRLGRGRRPR